MMALCTNCRLNFAFQHAHTLHTLRAIFYDPGTISDTLVIGHLMICSSTALSFIQALCKCIGQMLTIKKQELRRCNTLCTSRFKFNQAD